MSTKFLWFRCLLILALIVTPFSFAGPALAWSSVGASFGNFQTCPPRTCGPQLVRGNAVNKSPLELLDYSAINASNLFVNNVRGASSDPADIVQLVNDAITVWEAAFEPGSLPDINLYVGWADFGVRKISSANETLLVSTSESYEQNDYKPNSSNLSAAIAGDIIGLHICGAPAQSPPTDCSESDLKEATILFNSEILEDKASGSTIKLFLDTNPFISSAFGPIDEIGIDGIENIFRVGASSAFEDTFVVDLFTVALHEVGHVLGYSKVNPRANRLPPSAHITALGLPHVLSAYIPFSTRKCPSRRDVEEVMAIGPSVPDAPDYVLTNLDPCGVIRSSEQTLPELDLSRWTNNRRQLDIRLPDGNLIRNRDFTNRE